MTQQSMIPSLWIEASAGSGKTYQLVQRVLKLLMEDSPFNEILCVTFTNAAATEMEDRLLEKLEEWAICSDAALQADLETVMGRDVLEEHVLKARFLYEEYLWSDQKIAFTTLHGFCQHLLKIFAFEAGLSPNFKVLEEGDQDVLWQQAFEGVCRERKTGYLLEALVPDTTLQGLQSLLMKLLAQRHEWITLDGLNEKSERLFISLFEDLESVKSEVLWEGVRSQYPVTVVQGFSSFLAEGSKTDQEMGAHLLEHYKAFWDEPSHGSWARLMVGLLTQKGSLKKRLVTKKLAEAFPEASERFAHFCQGLYGCHQSILARQIQEKTQTLLAFFAEVYQRYDLSKQKKGMLDFDDLMIQTEALLKKPDYGTWIRYKLDRRLTHVLIDEAQDTSGLQWRLLLALLDDFFSQSDGIWGKSLFVVGDIKQSIFSFQGANTSLLQAYHAQIQEQFAVQKQTLEKQALSHSYRSSEPVLEFVDTLFGESRISQAPYFSSLKHSVERKLHGGKVTLWPLEEDTLEEDTQEVVVSGSYKLARKVAQTLKTWITEKRPLMGVNRPIEPRDVMILVQRRGAFATHMAHALSDYGVPCAGLDRLFLQDTLAVQDLQALCKFLLLPEDDFSLACALKSPLFSVEEGVLYELRRAQNLSLWESLREKAQTHTPLKHIEDTLLFFLNQVDYQAPSQVLSSILYEKKGMTLFVEALGTPVLEPLQEYVALCENYERKHGPSLEKWVHWFETQETVLKRSIHDKSLNHVRLMTIHASKGLQAPMVILPDTTEVAPVKGPLFWQEGGCVWASAAESVLPEVQEIKETAQAQQTQESERLLYVALTRAEEQLVLAGWQPRSERRLEGSWYKKFQDTMEALGGIQTPEGLTYQKDGSLEGEPAWKKEQEEPVPLPGFFQTPYQEQALSIVKPSSSSEDVPGSETEIQKEAMAYGTLMHKVLEFYPGTKDSDAYLDAVQVYLGKAGLPDLSQERKEKFFKDLRAVIQSETGKRMAVEDAYPEVSYHAKEGMSLVKGQIDLILKDEEAQTLWVLDYKTGKRPPETPVKYQNQLNAYAEFIKELYPGYQILPALIWVEEGVCESV